MEFAQSFLLNLRYAFRPRKPMLTLRLANAVLCAKLPGPPRLRYVDFAINFDCNLRCAHCFATSLRDDSRRQMDIEDYARVASQSMAAGAVNFSFQGGEPLLDKRLPDIIRACQPHKNVISVTTNGTLLTQERIADLRRWGVDILTVSLDSGIACEHDAFRNREGTHDEAIAGIDRALRAGLHVTVGTVVTHQNLHSDGMERLRHFAIDKKLLLYFILPVPAGEWKAQTDMLLTDEDLQQVEQWTRESPYLRTDFQANFGPKGCGAAKEILYLTPYGDVLVCPFLHQRWGNAFDEDIATIRDRALSNPYLDHYHDKCLVSTDLEFIEKHLSKTWDADNLPIDAPELEAETRTRSAER